ncbi:hypothetical protein BJ742DRAFT_831425 [Cladochytrium replicatum]|nr:hypothetical protein BJ742DRAFT_831425 [Cladochytrium replicatum]
MFGMWLTFLCAYRCASVFVDQWQRSDPITLDHPPSNSSASFIRTSMHTPWTQHVNTKYGSYPGIRRPQRSLLKHSFRTILHRLSLFNH